MMFHAAIQNGERRNYGVGRRPRGLSGIEACPLARIGL